MFDLARYRKSGFVIGLGLALVSTAFTVSLLINFGDTGISKIIYACFGILIQAGQTVILVLSLSFFQKGRSAAGVPGVLLYGLLFFLSICGTLGSFSTTAKDKTDAATKSDTSYQLMLSQLESLEADKSGNRQAIQDAIDSLDKQIAASTAQAETLAAKKFFTHGSKPLYAQIRTMQAERSELLSQLQGAGAGESTEADALREKIAGYRGVANTDAMYVMIGDFLGMTPDKTKFMIFVLYGLALDAVSACLLFYCSSGFADSDEETPLRKAVSRQSVSQGISQAQANAQIGFLGSAGGGVSPLESLENSLAENSLAKLTSTCQNRQADIQANESKDNAKTTVNESKETVSEPVKPVIDKSKVDSLDDPDDHMPSADAIALYIKALFAGQKKDASLTGKRKAQDAASLTSSQCDAVHSWLKRNNLVTVKGKKTFPLVAESEMLAEAGGLA